MTVSRADYSEMLLFITFGVIVGGMIAAGVFLVLLRRREPACGRCGYLVKGAVSFQCPECGADLREAGITCHDPARRAFGIAMLAGAATCAAVISLGAWLAM